MKQSHKSDSVKVVLRIRPLNPRESAEGCSTCLNKASATSTTIQAGTSSRSFGFDKVLGRKSTQQQSFAEVVPLLEQFSQGFNATLLAYGQTAAGKTHTVIGPYGALEAATQASAKGSDSIELPIESGILPRAAHHLFELVRDREQQGWRCTVSVSALEVYREEAKCLVGGNVVKVRESVEGGVHAKGLAEVQVDSPSSLLQAVQAGLAGRATGSTAMNDRSSRSHALCCFTLRQSRDGTHVEGANPPESGSSDGDEDDDDDEGGSGGARGPESLCSKLYLVDLAGAERQKKTKAEGTRLKEAVSINKGLLALGNVINALVARSGKGRRRGKGHRGGRGRGGEDAGDEGQHDDGEAGGVQDLVPTKTVHIPYRDSKLTRLLRDSLGGNAQTIMVACVSPADSSYDETLNTLRYASRARAIVNHATLGRDPQEGKIASLRAQVKQLQLALLQSGMGMGMGMGMSPITEITGIANPEELGPGSSGSSSSSFGGSSDEIGQKADAFSRAAQRISELERANTSLERELNRMSATAATSCAEASDLRQRLSAVEDQRNAAVGWIGQHSDTFDDIEAEAMKIFATSSSSARPAGGPQSSSDEGISESKGEIPSNVSNDSASSKAMSSSVSDEAAMNFLDEAFDGIAAELVQEHSGQQARLRSELSAIGRALEAKEGQLKATSTSSASMGVVGAEAAAEQTKVNARIKQLRTELTELEATSETTTDIMEGIGGGEDEDGAAETGVAGSAPGAKSKGGKSKGSKSKGKKSAARIVDPAQAARIEALKDEIKSLQGRAKDLRRVQTLRKKAEARSTQLSSEVSQLRKARQGVTRRMKQETQRFRDSLKQYEKEARDLRKENRKTAAEATRLATLADRQRATLKQKTKDLLTAQRKLRERERLAIQGKRSTAATGAPGLGGPAASGSGGSTSTGPSGPEASAEVVLRDDNALLTSCAAPRLEGGASHALFARSKHLRSVPGPVAACIAGEIRTYLALKGCEGLRESLLKARTQVAAQIQDASAGDSEVARARADVAELTQELAGVTSSQAKLRETSKLGVKVLSGSCKGFGWERGIADIRAGRATVGWLLDVTSAAVWHADKATSRAEQEVSQARESLKEAQLERDNAVSQRLDAEARAADASREAEERLVAFMGFSSGQEGGEESYVADENSACVTPGAGNGVGDSAAVAATAVTAKMTQMRAEIAKLAGVHDKLSRLEAAVSKHKQEATDAEEKRKQLEVALEEAQADLVAAEVDGQRMRHLRDPAQNGANSASQAGARARKPSGSKADPAGQSKTAGGAPNRSKARTHAGGTGKDRVADSGISGGGKPKSTRGSANSSHIRPTGTKRPSAARRMDAADSSGSDDPSEQAKAAAAARRRKAKQSARRRRSYVLVSASDASDSDTDFYDDSSDSDWREDEPKEPPKTVKKKRSSQAHARTASTGSSAGISRGGPTGASSVGRTGSKGNVRAVGNLKSAASKPKTIGTRAPSAASTASSGVAPPAVPNIRLSVVHRRPAGTSSTVSKARGSVRDATGSAQSGGSSSNQRASVPTGRKALPVAAKSRHLGAKTRAPLGVVRGQE